MAGLRGELWRPCKVHLLRWCHGPSGCSAVWCPDHLSRADANTATASGLVQTWGKHRTDPRAWCSNLFLLLLSLKTLFWDIFQYFGMFTGEKLRLVKVFFLQTRWRIVIQILIHLPESQQTSETQFTYVETKRFVTPVRRLGVSGGTAPFFSLQLAAAEGKSSGDYWIGKDLSRAMDEVQFYEKAIGCNVCGLWIQYRVKEPIILCYSLTVCLFSIHHEN